MQDEKRVRADSIPVYSVFDSKGDAWSFPWLARTDETAQRMFAASALDPANDICKFAGDFTLFRIGFWDDNNGKFDMEETKKDLGTALQIRSRYEVNN